MKNTFRLFDPFDFRLSPSAFRLLPRPLWERAGERVRFRLLTLVFSLLPLSLYAQSSSRADSLCSLPPLTVMQKASAPISGDMHDYYSLARYFWPDSTKADGLPYVNRDGLTNPEIDLYDRNRLGEMVERVILLADTYQSTSDERYAEAAVRQLRAWFLDPNTRMNPHLRFAQVARGHNDNQGRCYGVLDAYSLVSMLDAVSRLQASKAYTKRDHKQLQAWFEDLLHWMLTSRQGLDEADQANNHSIAYDAQVVSFALFVGDRATATRVIRSFPQRRLYHQVAPDGSQPHELTRTRSLHYSVYNLTHMIDLAEMARRLDINLLDSVSVDGRSITRAADYIASYLPDAQHHWPHPEMDAASAERDFYRQLHRLRMLDTSSSAVALREAMHQMRQLTITTNMAYTAACMDNPSQLQTLAPRNLQPDGHIRFVGWEDWCVGFYPGCLWLLETFSQDSVFRAEAIQATRRIEASKDHLGSHDLGFILNCSYGHMYDRTGEGREVLLRAADNLMLRFDSVVGCTRSWDFNAHLWSFPVIIDNMMNLELLFRASLLTGDPRYHDAAVSHANRTMYHHFRPDGSSYHLVDYDTITGDVRHRQTFQGAGDESVWSRGQAWGLYGFTMCYRFTQDPRYLHQAQRIAEFIFSQPNMPADLIPYWDMRIPDAFRASHPVEIKTLHNPEEDAPRDVSAAAVTASALYELAEYVSGQEADTYRAWADTILSSLTHHYRHPLGEGRGFLLREAVGHMPAGSEICTSIIYADYYYLEALLRQHKYLQTYQLTTQSDRTPCGLRNLQPGLSLYASSPRFRALLVYDPSAEPDHVIFDRQAIDFFHHLSYGEGFLYDVTTTLDTFTLAGLKQYDVLVMLNAQPGRASRRIFEQYMEQGGGWLGFHASAFYNEQSDWAWYHDFLGCGPFLCNNWPPQPALLTCDSLQPSQFLLRPPYSGCSLTSNLPPSFVCPASEYYQWYPSPRTNPDVEVYLTLSPRNYPLGIKDIIYSGDMPLVWSNRKYRMLYINMGHGDQSFIDPTQNLLFTNALRWVIAPATVPDASPSGSASTDGFIGKKVNN